LFWKNKDRRKSGYEKPLRRGKGANLAEMSRPGIPVPAGFTITRPDAVMTFSKIKASFLRA
jgi:phosphoenolpyruvate synthase/pyruvate phosphate dikinase